MKSSKTGKKKPVSLGDEYLDPKNHKLRVSMWMDGDLVAELKKRAEEVGAGYQTYMHKILRDAVMEKDSLERRIEKVENQLAAQNGKTG